MLIKRGFSVWMACAALALLLTACGGAQSRFAGYMKRGEGYFDHSDYPRAMVEFRNAMQIKPKDAAAHLMAARTAEKLGRVREALGLYQAAVDSAPQNIEARQGLARLLISAGGPELALKVIDPGLAQHPDEPTLLALRGAAYVLLKKPTEAVADVEHALRVAPGNEEAIEVRARLYQESGDLLAATALVSSAVQRSPGSTPLHEVLASLYAAADRPEQAEQQLQELIRLAPKDARYRYQLADFYLRAHKPDATQQVLEAATQALPGNDQMKLALVDFITTQRTRAQGEQVLRGFIARDPKNYNLRLSLAQLLQRFGSIKEATEVYQEVIRLDGTGPEGLIARNRLASIALTQGRDQAAQDLTKAVLEKNPHDVDALTLRGAVELRRNDATTAVADFRAVVRDQPENVHAKWLLAQAYLANGEAPLAEESLRDAVKLAPADDSLLVALAELLSRTQRLDAAISMLEERTQAAPSDPQVRDALTRAYLAKPDFAAAAKAAEDLKILRPAAADGFYLAGLAAQGDKRLDDAQQQFGRALALQPEALDVLSALAHLEYHRGHTAQAVALVKNSVEHQPPNAYALNLLGELYLAQKDVPAATDVLTQAVRLSPSWSVPYRSLAAARIAANDSAGAIAAYSQGIKAAPAEPQLIMELGQLYVSQGRIDDAIASYEEWYRRNPQAQLVANNLAMLLVTYRTDQKSLDRARDLTAGFASSSNGSLLDTAGWVHFKRAEYAQALPELEHAAQERPESAEIRYHLGMAEMRAGLADRARTDLETAVAGSQRFDGSKEARAVLATLKNSG